jgi:FMN phosphatase YigB (HAD superfamily)
MSGNAPDIRVVLFDVGGVPDADAFQHAVQSLGCAPEQVLFIDDNLLNVEAALRSGMHAVRARGNLETRRALGEFGIIERTIKRII